MDYKLIQNVKVNVTDHLSEAIIAIIEEKKYKKPFIVMDSFLKTVPIIKSLLEQMKKQNLEYVVYDKVVPDPPTEVVDDGASIFSAINCDCIIAIGGGSSIDVARGINIIRVNGGKIADYVDPNKEIKPCPDMIAVPTTSGTGSEMSNALIVTDKNSQSKLAVLADNAVSEYAVLNPDLVMTLPKNMTIATGLDAFAHAAEAYTSNLSSPITDAICEKVMNLIVKYLPCAVANGNDREARERMMVAAALGGWMLNNGGTHLGHSIAHIVGSKYHIPHGMACAYSLPGVLEFISPVESKKVKEIGYILGASYPENTTDLEIGNITAKAFRNFRDNILGMSPFSDLDINKEELLSNAENVVTERFAGNSPRELDIDSARSLLDKLYEEI
jgi:alcohol dehydrogenase class IV